MPTIRLIYKEEIKKIKIINFDTKKSKKIYRPKIITCAFVLIIF